MNKVKENIIVQELVFTKSDDYIMLVKLKLTLTVVLTSLLGFFIASSAKSSIIWSDALILFIGGFLVTAAANTINQVLEKDFDALMNRTANRPLAAGRMKVSEAVLFAGLSCLLGITVLAMFNPVTALVGMISFMLYSFIYTPLKRYSTLAVAVGAIPGALPVLLGCTAVEGKISLLALTLFVIQFLWQFPHFWAIGYLGFEDYKKAGYKLLPIDMNDKIDRSLGLYSMMYALLILPSIVYLSHIGYLGLGGMIVCVLATLTYAYFAYQFHKSFNRSSAMGLMFCSFFFMPLVLITCIISI